MAAVGSGWILSPAQLQEDSSAKWRTSILCVAVISILIVFSVSLALFPLVIPALQSPAEFASVEVARRVCNSLYGRVSPACMYVVLNVVIVIIGIKSGIFHSSNIDERCSACVEVHFDKKASVKAVYANSGKADLRLQPPVTEVDGSIPARCDRIRKFKSPPSLISGESISKSAPNEELLRRDYPRNNSDLATSGISVECRIGESPPSKPRNANEIMCEEFPSSPRLFFIEVSDGKGEAGADRGQREVMEDLSADELYVKAETFIGNFYRQLKMQREDS